MIYYLPYRFSKNYHKDCCTVKKKQGQKGGKGGRQAECVRCDGTVAEKADTNSP
jgi:hypothetical protein